MRIREWGGGDSKVCTAPVFAIPTFYLSVSLSLSLSPYRSATFLTAAIYACLAKLVSWETLSTH
jgi:hypothetical protein